MIVNEIDRRGFLRGMGAAAIAAGGVGAAKAQSVEKGVRLGGDGASAIYAGMTMEEIKKVFPQLKPTQFSLPGALPKITGTQSFAASVDISNGSVAFMFTNDDRVYGICNIISPIKVQNYPAEDVNELLKKSATQKGNTVEEPKRLEGPEGKFAYWTRYTRSGIVGNYVVTGQNNKVTGAYITTKATSMPSVASTTQQQQQEPQSAQQVNNNYSKELGVKGIMIGMSPSQVQSKLESMGIKTQKFANVNDGKVDGLEFDQQKYFTVAGQTFNPYFEFNNGRLVQITMYVYEEIHNINYIADALENKFGKGIKIEKVKTRNGVEHNGIIGEWKTADGTILLKQHYYKLGSGILQLTGNEKIANTAKSSADNIQRARGDI